MCDWWARVVLARRMAPILSKMPLQPPQSAQQHIAALARKRARPLLDAFLDTLQWSLERGHVALSEGVPLLSGLSDRIVTQTIKMLEDYCCMDLTKFARGPDPPLHGSLPILFVLMLLLMLYNAFVLGYMPAAGIALNSPTSMLFHAFIFLVFASFTQAIRTDPGGVPPGREWRTYGSPPPDLRQRKHDSDEPRWCRKSESYKPDRAHFCRVMQRPVLRMDHHCPWLGNTVGHGNHKFFYLFLFYTTIACMFLGVNVLQLLVQETLPALNTFLLLGSGGLTLLLSVILVPFFLFHTWLLVRNMTTIEFVEKLRAYREEGGAEFSTESAYDLGVFENVRSVLGESPLFWLLPVGGLGKRRGSRRSAGRWRPGAAASLALGFGGRAALADISCRLVRESLGLLHRPWSCSSTRDGRDMIQRARPHTCPALALHPTRLATCLSLSAAPLAACPLAQCTVAISLWQHSLQIGHTRTAIGPSMSRSHCWHIANTCLRAPPALFARTSGAESAHIWRSEHLCTARPFLCLRIPPAQRAPAARAVNLHQPAFHLIPAKM